LYGPDGQRACSHALQQRPKWGGGSGFSTLRCEWEAGSESLGVKAGVAGPVSGAERNFPESNSLLEGSNKEEYFEAAALALHDEPADAAGGAIPSRGVLAESGHNCLSLAWPGWA